MSKILRTIRISPSVFYTLALGSMFLSLFMWFLGPTKAAEEGKEGATERLGIFVGLWPPTLMLLGKIAEDAQGKGTRRFGMF
jgi:hypothetical protein